MIDVRKETPILLSEFAKRMKRDYDTVRKWCNRGVIADPARPEKGRVKLEAIWLTDGRATTVEAYQRFIEKINSARGIGS